MRIETNTLTAAAFETLFRSVGWDPPDRDQIETSLRHSAATFTAYDGNEAVGMVRLPGDGGMSFYLKDLAVAPPFQGQGIGGERSAGEAL